MDIVDGPGGALYRTDLQTGNDVWVRKPAGPARAFDVYPWSGRSNMRSALSGDGFKRSGESGGAELTGGQAWLLRLGGWLGKALAGHCITG